MLDFENNNLPHRKLFVVSGFSGSGKGSVLINLLKNSELYSAN